MASKSIKELRAECKARNIKGYSSKNRAELEALLGQTPAAAASSAAASSSSSSSTSAVAAIDSSAPNRASTSRDNRTKFFSDLHDFIWNRAGLDPQQSFDHMTFFLALRMMEPYIAQNLASFNRNCLWSHIVSLVGNPCILYDAVFKEDPSSAFGMLVTHPSTAFMFGGFINQIVSAELVTDIIRCVNAFQFDNDRDNLGDLFEYMLGCGNETMANRGAYFTPRSICRLAFKLAYQIKGTIRREDGTLCTMADFFCGTGGFMAEYIRGCARISRESGAPCDWARDQKSIFCADVSQTSVRIALINALVVTGIPFNAKQFVRADSFRDSMMFMPPTVDDSENPDDEGADPAEIEESYAIHMKFPQLHMCNGVDYGLSNPPYGGDKGFKYYAGKGPNRRCEMSHDIQSIGVECNVKAAAGLELCMATLAPQGVQCVVLPQGFFFQISGPFATLRKKLIEEYRVHYVVEIPGGEFLNTGTKTGIIIFQKGVGPTETVRFITNKEEPICTVPVATIREYEYSLLSDKYSRRLTIDPSLWELKMSKLSEVITIISGHEPTYDDGKYPIYGGGDKNLRGTSQWNYESTFIIAKAGFNSGTVRFIELPFWLHVSGWTFTTRDENIINDTFVGCYLMRNQTLSKMNAIGTAQLNLNQENFRELPIYYPAIEIQHEFADIARPLLKLISAEKHWLSELESSIMGYIRSFRREPSAQEVPMNELIELVRAKGHPVGEGVDERDAEHKWPLLQSSRDGRNKWFAADVPDFTERLIAMGTGGIANVTMRENFCVSTDFIVFRARDRDNRILLSYLYYLIRSELDYIDKTFFNGTTLENLQRPLFLEWRVPIPALDVQHSLDSLFAEAWNKKERIEDYTARLNALMEKYIPKVNVESVRANAGANAGAPASDGASSSHSAGAGSAPSDE